MRVKSLAEIREKWQRVTAQRAPDYQAGVENPKVDWAQATAAAEGNYEQGVQQSIAAKRFGKGVKRVGSSKWAKGAIEKGVARWPTGVAAAGPEFEKGFGPFRDALERLTLPPRRARRDPANLNRVKAVVDNMIATAERAGGK